MKHRRAVLSLGFVALAACPAVAGTDDQKTEQVVTKQAAQDGFRLCNLTGQPIEVAKATFSAKRPANEAFVAEGWFISPQGQTWGERLEQLLGPGSHAVINHGGVGYSTAQNLVQTAFYESTSGATAALRALLHWLERSAQHSCRPSRSRLCRLPNAFIGRLRSMPGGPPAHACRYHRCSA